MDTRCKNASPGGGDNGKDDEQDPDGTTEDPIASDSDGYTMLAENPIWDPREYFLRIVDIRMKEVLEEWRNSAWKIDASVRRYV